MGVGVSVNRAKGHFDRSGHNGGSYGTMGADGAPRAYGRGKGSGNACDKPLDLQEQVQAHTNKNPNARLLNAHVLKTRLLEMRHSISIPRCTILSMSA